MRTVIYALLLVAAAKDSASTAPAAPAASSLLENNNILTTLTAQTKDTTQLLSQKSVDYAKLQSLLSAKLAKFAERHSVLTAELGRDDTSNSVIMSRSSSVTEAIHESMDEMSLKLLELIKRTEDVTKRIGEWNRVALVQNNNNGSGNGNSISAGEKNSGVADLQERLRNVMREEIERRDRFVVRLIHREERSGNASDDNSDDNEEALHAADEDDNNEDDNNEDDNNEDVPSPYMTITQLDQLLSTNTIITPSEMELKSKFMALAKNMMEERTMNDDEFWKNHFETLPQKLQQKQQQHLQQQQLLNSNNDHDGKCINIPSAVQLVSNALTSHYQDGGIGRMDVASYENGGSVVYELTSLPYQPPPRNNNHQDRHHRDDQRQELLLVDKATERMYHEQQNDMMNGGESNGSIGQKLHDALDNIDIWDWYTNFKLNSIRNYLPDDWERLLDRYFSSVGTTTTTTNWGDYTPRGIVDALIPDYIYHAFGISNMAGYGSVYGRTASPEVAITAGYSKVGGGGGGGGMTGGWSAKALGNCYPLSMRPENDPILSLLSRHTHMEGGMEVVDEDVSASSLVGPKYTVRLPYPIHIDAVSIEHRAFPLPQSVLKDGVRGGESAPRWVKVVGFPPCGDDNDKIEAEEEGCDKLGFDISRPIDLGSFEYHPATVSGREDDYGGGDGDETSDSVSRRRSIQTFTVKGGMVKESGSEEEGGDDISTDEPELEVEDYEIPAGSCAPPKEPDDVPSCGGDMSTSSDQSERQIVSAVSFIIEENWGNNEYTCLYRVRVHGDAISG